MEPPKTSHAVKAAEELADSLKDVTCLLSGAHESVLEVNAQFDHGYDGPGSSMVHFGVSLVMLPEPFMISDVVGGGVIAAGLLYKKFVPPPLYIDNIFETIQEQVKAIHLEGVNLTENFSEPIDLSSIKFDI